MYLLPGKEIYEWDRFTIHEEGIRSIDLMDRAVQAFMAAFRQLKYSTEIPVHVFCGPGNNGGDGIGIAMNLRDAFYDVTVYFCDTGGEAPDLKQMKKRVGQYRDIEVVKLKAGGPLPVLPQKALIIDALFGIGLSRPITGYWAELIGVINKSGSRIISVDTPSGLPSDAYVSGASIQADHTISFQVPKFSHLMPENEKYTGQLHVVDIGLSSNFTPASCNRLLLTAKMASSFLIERKKFDHKGSFGHATLVCGGRGMIGAAALAAKACLRAGVGKLTMQIPACGYNIIQSLVPEALASEVGDNSIQFIETDFDIRSIGIGCGIGKSEETVRALDEFLSSEYRASLVLDADALNIISENNWHDRIRNNTILTPHPREFDRLFGSHDNHMERTRTARQKALDMRICIILKGAYSSISMPDGRQFFNASGNVGLATAGSGDVLTGIVTSLLAQGYTAENAALLGTYLHGLAADAAIESIHERSLIAGDVTDYISEAYQILQS